MQLVVKRSLSYIIRKAVKPDKFTSKKEERQREDTLIGIFKTASAVVLWGIGIIVILTIFDVNIAALLTGAGLIGVLVGFGAQNTIKDFLSGIFIIAENQYRVGDIVAINGVSGIVEIVSIRITRLRDLDGIVHFVPNGTITTVSNMTYDYANVNLDINVAYNTDIDKVEKVINEAGLALFKDPEWKEKIIEPIKFVRLDKFAESAITIKVLGKVKPAEQWSVSGEYKRRLKEAFKKNGIEIPLPQMVFRQAGK